MLIRSVRPGKRDSTSGYCFISVSTSLRCSDVTVSEILTSERYNQLAEIPHCRRRQLTQ